MNLEQVFWSPGVTLEGMEKQIILKAFRFYRGNKTQCAISLGINVRTLERKLEDYANEDKKREDLAVSHDELAAEQLKRARGIVGAPVEVSGPIIAAQSERIRAEQEKLKADAVHSADSGVHMEPADETSAQHAVPVSQRKEVQSVLPKHANTGGQRSRR